MALSCVGRNGRNCGWSSCCNAQICGGWGQDPRQPGQTVSYFQCRCPSASNTTTENKARLPGSAGSKVLHYFSGPSFAIHLGPPEFVLPLQKKTAKLHLAVAVRGTLLFGKSFLQQLAPAEEGSCGGALWARPQANVLCRATPLQFEKFTCSRGPGPQSELRTCWSLPPALTCALNWAPPCLEAQTWQNLFRSSCCSTLQSQRHPGRWLGLQELPAKGIGIFCSVGIPKSFWPWTSWQ